MATDHRSLVQIERELMEWDTGVSPSITAIQNLIAVLNCLNEPNIVVDPEDGAIYARWSCSGQTNNFTICFIGNQIVNFLSKSDQIN